MTDNQPWQPPPAPTVTSPAPGASRPVRVVSWLGWHVIELAGVGVPTVLAVSGNGWWSVLAIGVGVGWVSHEVRLSRRRREVHAALPPAIEPHSSQLEHDQHPLAGNTDEGKEVNDRGLA